MKRKLLSIFQVIFWYFSLQSYPIRYHTLFVEYETEDDREIQLTIPFFSHFENEDILISFDEIKDSIGKHYRIELHPLKPIELDQIKLQTTITLENYFSYFCNGFQSWTVSREYFAWEKIDRISPLGKLVAKYYGDYTYFPYQPRRGNLHSWTYTYLRDSSQQYITLLASVSEFSGFTIFSYQLKDKSLSIIKEINDLKLPAGKIYMALEWLEATGNENELFRWYARKNFDNVRAAAAKKGVDIQPSDVRPARGWTSWYHYYRDIATDTILKNLRAFEHHQLPIQIFQIDDGYQKSVGEWTASNSRFPRGMKPIADSIHSQHLLAGLWLAPYVVEKKSALYRNNKDWLLKNEKGKIIKAGYNPLWSGWFYPLDIYNTDVQHYLKNTFDTLLNIQGYDMLKLDFLFAACISPPLDKTRGEMMFDAMLMLRQWCGEKLILGCGVPLGSAFHLVDYCRVSSDIHMKWEHRLLKMLRIREQVSVKNTITTNIGRRHLNGNMFWNDPDVFVLRNEKNKLSAAEKNSLFAINNLFGALVFTSDYVGNYDQPTMKKYRDSFLSKQTIAPQVRILKRDIYLMHDVANGRWIIGNFSSRKYCTQGTDFAGIPSCIKQHSVRIISDESELNLLLND